VFNSRKPKVATDSLNLQQMIKEEQKTEIEKNLAKF
jgi:hypothetical protein